MKKKDKIDLVSSMVWLLVGILVSSESIKIGLGSSKDPGPGLIPFAVGIVLVILAVALFICLVFGITRANNYEDILGANWKKVGAVIISLTVYASLLPVLGYLICTFLLIGYLFNLTSWKGWLRRLIGAGMVAFITFIVFRFGLDCRLPVGILGGWF